MTREQTRRAKAKTRRNKKPRTLTATPMVMIWRDAHPKEWTSWMAHFRRTGQRNFANYCETQGYCKLPSPFPPNEMPPKTAIDLAARITGER